ncbi:1,4-dihydroxy-2-naphthoate octaprenyltransferase [Fulvitalea axinellae]|uniref:1,4-dihydroxy-2-naphthoate octaprenyltransferase n=1 Tax=Fulvitalea axinellae TaxID=1182444 RepID=A0AAU9D5Y2_9BACT|nr:1,4-dihydroxy-2-naphthoate octaprenyltransferase [Fulvitalea axinellae]
MSDKTSTAKAWISAFRLRTLPLALASIGMAAFIAASRGEYSAPVFWLSVLTTTLLQVLSNLANDYGDSIHGADSVERQGPSRAVQAGAISPAAMKTGMYVCGILAFVSGVALLYIALGTDWKALLFFLGLGLASIFAAVTYTAGKKPYGYAGLGDLSVLLFFGFTGVMGSLFLYNRNLEFSDLLPAISCGLFAVAVLNINNIRDVKSDRLAGKFSLPVRIGIKKAVFYHFFLLSLGLILAVIYTLINYHSNWQFLFAVSVPMMIYNSLGVSRYGENPKRLDPFLKQMALTALVFVLSFGSGLILAGS